MQNYERYDGHFSGYVVLHCTLGFKICLSNCLYLDMFYVKHSTDILYEFHWLTLKLMDKELIP